MINSVPLPTHDVLFKQRILLGIGFLAIFFSNQGLSILAIPYYQMTLGIDPFLLALAMKAPVIIASFTAPFIGHWSDNSASRFGRRKPFIIIFSWLSCVVYGSIWMVPTSWSNEAQLYYFSAMALLFYLINTCWTLPMKCLAYEASRDYHERTKIMGSVTYFIKFGGVLYHWVFPLAKLSIFGGVIVGIKFVGWGVAFVCLGIFAFLPGWLLKERRFKKADLNKKEPLFKSLKLIVRNKNMKVLLAILATQLTLGTFAASMDYYVLVYHMSAGDIGDGATLKGVLSSSYALAGIASIWVLTFVSKKVGKKTTLKWVYFVTFIGGLLKWFIYQPGNGWWLILDAILCCSIWGSMVVLVSSMVVDQIDVDELNHRVRREGLFASLQSWIIAIASSISMICSGLALNMIGFNALDGSEQGEGVILSIRLFLVIGTALSSLIGYCFLKKYDFEEEDFDKVRSQLISR